MKPVYEIKFLGSKDFDKLPKTETNGADISDSLGFYNPYTNRIFIRHTAIPELDKYLLEHEFEHILEKEATDEDEFGIRHKKKNGFLKILSFLNPATAPIAISNEVYNKGKDPVSSGPLSGVLGGAQKSQSSEQPMQSSFGNLGFAQPQSQGISFGSSQSPFSDQQSSGQGLNQGLNQQSVNPLSQDPYSQYGRPAGRLYF